MNHPFFIVGLPKSRLAWLANLLTTDTSLCYFGALSRCRKIGDLQEILAVRQDKATIVGDADPLIGCVAGEFWKTFPESKVVFVQRSFNESLMAEMFSIRQERGFQEESFTIDALIKYLRRTQNGLDTLWRTIPSDQKLWVAYNDLDKMETVKQIWNFCLPGIPFPEQRYKMLDFLNVSQICMKVLKAYPHQPFREMLAATEKE